MSTPSLTYQSALPRGRSALKSLALLLCTLPLLYLLLTLIAASLALLHPIWPAFLNAPLQPLVYLQLALNLLLLLASLTLVFLLAKHANPYRSLPVFAPGQRAATFTRLSLAAGALALLTPAAALLAPHILGLALRTNFLYHLGLPPALIARCFPTLLLLFPLAAMTIALTDILTATTSPLHRRGYLLTLAALLATALYFPLFHSAQARASRTIAAALREREMNTIALGMLATPGGARHAPSDAPQLAGDFIFFDVPTALLIPAPPAPLGTGSATLVRAIKRTPLPAIPTLQENFTTHTLEYPHEGYLICFADLHVEIIRPATGPKPGPPTTPPAPPPASPHNPTPSPNPRAHNLAATRFEVAPK